ncbi:MAG: SAM-dependent chlorinase/fluorinase [Gemmatimonadales bacterium]|nr:SAM-dependent chlorinase/fluorinase [Gemmatimonadales bacterium]
MALLTLLTDFGTADSYVAEMKGVVLVHAPEARFVDITHAVSPEDVAGGAYVFERAWRRFPYGTVHLAVVDPGVGTSRRGLVLHAGGHLFVGPDNGLLTSAISEPDCRAWVLPVPDGAAPTFHGRDVFAPAAAALLGGAAPESLGVPVMPDRLTRLDTPVPERVNGGWIGRVLHRDRFGNCITTLRPEHVPPGSMVIAGGRVLGTLRRTFSDVAELELLAYVGSAGYVEIAVNGGSAVEELGYVFDIEVKLPTG